MPPKLVVENFEGGQVQGKQKKITDKRSFWELRGACAPSRHLLALPPAVIKATRTFFLLLFGSTRVDLVVGK